MAVHKITNPAKLATDKNSKSVEQLQAENTELKATVDTLLGVTEEVTP